MDEVIRITIPYNDAGKRCYEVLAYIAMKQLTRAREAVQSFMDEFLPDAQLDDEKAMYEGKYWAFISMSNGQKKQVVYNHRTKEIESYDLQLDIIKYSTESFETSIKKGA